MRAISTAALIAFLFLFGSCTARWYFNPYRDAIRANRSANLMRLEDAGTNIAIVVGWLAVGAMVAIPLYGGWLLAKRHEERRNRHVDGFLPVREVHLDPWPVRIASAFRGQISRRAIVDPNRSISGNIGIGSAGVGDIVPTAGWQLSAEDNRLHALTQRVHAAMPGNAAYEDGGLGVSGGFITANAAKMLMEPPPEPDQPISIEPVRQPPTVDEALRNSSADQFALGYNTENGDVCYFDWHADNGIAVAGAPGTGKTFGVGYFAVLHALKNGWHVIILDPKNGIDFRWMAGHVEWHETNIHTIVDQLSSINLEMDRRLKTLVSLGGNELADAPTVGPRTLVLIEEFGVLIERTKKYGNGRDVEFLLTEFNRLSRAAGMHPMFIDQSSKRWTDEMIAAAGCHLVYRSTVHTAGVLGSHKATKLQGGGVFQRGDELYQSWDMKPEMKTRIAALPMHAFPPIIEGEVVGRSLTNGGHVESQVVAKSPPPFLAENGTNGANAPEVEPTNGTNVRDAGYWRTFVANYMENERENGTANGLWNEPPTGVNDLARAMSRDATGSPDDYQNYKSMASTLSRKIREAKND